MNRMSDLPSGSLPLVYSCSGCSNNAQLTNCVALELDTEGVAEMSCIAGVGGNVKSLVRKARSGRLIIALDGCHLGCVKGCLDQRGVRPDLHYTLTDYGFRKRYKADFDREGAATVKRRVMEDLSRLERD